MRVQEEECGMMGKALRKLNQLTLAANKLKGPEPRVEAEMTGESVTTLRPRTQRWDE